MSGRSDFNPRWNHLGLGALTGIVGAALGFLLFASIWSYQNGKSLPYFVEEVFLNTSFLRWKIVSVSILLNVVLFYLGMRKEAYRFSSGLLLILMLGVVAAVVLYE